MLVLTGTACADRSLLSVDELKAALGSGADPTATQIADLRGRTESTICRTCRVPGAGVTPPTLRVEALTETFRLKSHQSMLVLSRRPIASIVSITENDTALVSTDYETEVASGLLRRLSSDVETRWPCGKIVVVYTAGWATVPDDLKLAASKLAAAFWTEAGSGNANPNLKRENIPGVMEREYWVSGNDENVIPQEVMDLLGPYLNLAA